MFWTAVGFFVPIFGTPLVQNCPRILEALVDASSAAALFSPTFKKGVCVYHRVVGTYV